jgi:hypothetical protein
MTLALGLVAAAASLNTFGGTEQLVFFRESSTGQSDVAYFLGMQFAELPHLVLAPVVFVIGFSLLTSPTISLFAMWQIAFGVFFCCSGAAHVVSIVVSQELSLIVVVLYCSIMAQLAGISPTRAELRESMGASVADTLTSLSFSRWAAESYYVGVVGVYRNIYDVSITLNALEYSYESAAKGVWILLALGFGARVIALFALLLCHKDKRR